MQRMTIYASLLFSSITNLFLEDLQHINVRIGHAEPMDDEGVLVLDDH